MLAVTTLSNFDRRAGPRATIELADQLITGLLVTYHHFSGLLAAARKERHKVSLISLTIEAVRLVSSSEI